MTREEVSALWVDYINGSLTKEQEKEIVTFLKDNPEVKKEFQLMGDLWKKMEEIPTPEPSKQMDMKFQAMLQGYEIGQSKKTDFIEVLSSFLRSLFESRMSLATMMLIVGLGLGYLLNTGANEQLTNLNAEVFEMKKMMMLTLIEQPKALDRMKAVQISNEISQPDEKIVEALLQTLNNDSNVNVRLVAAQSLAGLADNPIVRAGLIESIALQTSPVLQNALADIMIELMEKKSISEFEKLLQQQNLDTLVKEKIKTTLETLI